MTQHVETSSLLEVEDLKVHFKLKRGKLVR